MATITLAMIVKNESKVIERCLESLLPLKLDYWVIQDTGSTDGTQDIIRNFFSKHNIPGEVIEVPWKDFAYNRSLVLEQARDKADYSYMIDADEILVFEPGFDADNFKNNLKADRYDIYAIFGTTHYHRPQMCSNKKKFYYRGVLHEYLSCYDSVDSADFAKGFYNRPVQDGNRSSDAAKYFKDADLLEAALKDPNVDVVEIPRYQFYFAQCLRDSGQKERALEAYMKRVELGGWVEEVGYSLLQIGHLKEQLNYPADNVLQTYLQAHEVTPWRAEPLWAAARLCRSIGRIEDCYVYSFNGLKKPYPFGALFVTKAIYDYALLDEYAWACYWTGRYGSAKRAIYKRLNDGFCEQALANKLQENLRLIDEFLKYPDPLSMPHNSKPFELPPLKTIQSPPSNINVQPSANAQTISNPDQNNQNKELMSILQRNAGSAVGV